MACKFNSISTSPTVKDSIKGSKQRTVTRTKLSYSDNNVCYSPNRARMLMNLSQNKYSHCSMGTFDFETSKEMNGEERNELKNVGDREMEMDKEKKTANWIERLLQIQSQYVTLKQQQDNEADVVEPDVVEDGEKGCKDGGSRDGYSDDGGESMGFNRETFSMWLKNASWSDTKIFSKLAFLSNMAYRIPTIEAEDLKRYYDLEFITSSLEKKEQEKASIAELDQEAVPSSWLDNFEMAAYMAASTMTAAVMPGENEKQDIANSQQSYHAFSPCEWFVCDDTNIYIRHFIIQGLDSMASWQAYLSFEPTKFEGTDVLVHRGIYEVAKELYGQIMPEIMEHLEKYGEKAKLQFTGHSIGGSLSVIINLMLLTRMVVKPSALSPVVTFGSPFVFYDGQKILDEFGLDENHIHCMIMHRDIVPRAFSSTLPDYVAELVKRFSSTFESHACLGTNKSLYTPMGEVFILQPDEMSSPAHCLLPPGVALYALEHSNCFSTKSALITAFLNSPHLMEILSDLTAYGHDSSSYLKALNMLIRQSTKMFVQGVKKQQSLLWPLLTSNLPHASSQELTLDERVDNNPE